ncbi:site-2 protease family protein [Candidatus Pacearchaeota archaeon]|nr:site-2 protease family protein [Candidatus Pacearchaeota archaeon]
MNFVIFDISLLVLFVIFMSIFLYIKKKNLKKEGLLVLYKTSWGIKLINYLGNKYKKALHVLSYVSIGLGYVLMASMLYLFGKIVWLYVFRQDIVRAIKIPPIMPLVPYLPQIFKLDFLPPFYFTYWILIIAVIAITHELSHGIFAASNLIRIKKTGFGFFPFFLPVFLAAFVELDEKQMAKESKFKQMAVLSAGTFANVLTAIFFFAIMWLFFSLAFAPSGVIFDDYAYSVVGISSISFINGIPLQNSSYENILQVINETGFSELESGGGNYLVTKDFLEQQKETTEYLVLYNDAPAIRAGLKGVINEINGVTIESKEILSEELEKYSPGDEIIIKTQISDSELPEFLEYKIVLGEHPEKENFPWLGVGFTTQERTGVMGRIVSFVSSFKKPSIYYEPKFGAGLFIYNLLWWLVLISFSVALINMLPMGIFDGGRFFYLTVFGITKSKKIADKSFKFITFFFLFLIFLLMAFWLFSFLT